MVLLKGLNIATAAMLMAVTMGAFAIECNQISPNLDKEGDAYFNIEKIKLPTKQQEAQISNLFSLFAGHRLHGYAISTECVGPEKHAKKKMTKELISAEIQELSEGALVIAVEFVNEKKKVSHSERLRYFGHNNPFKIVKLSNDSLVVISKLRINKALNEDITTISASGRSLTLTITRYRNGYFAYHRNIQLHS
jgi:hypothetical protein